MNIHDWLKETDTELAHWDYVFYKHQIDSKSYLHKYVNTRLNTNLPIHKNVQSLVELIDKDEVSILDVGSGPLPFLGKKSSKAIKIIAIDYLADKYYNLYNKYNVYPSVWPIHMDATKMSSFFNHNKFDIVYARNSVDHMIDPIQCIIEMTKVSNNFVILEHKLNEGITENYRGLHNWNFFIKDEKFYISDKMGNETCINNILSNTKIQCKITTEEEESIPDWLVVVISQNKS